MDFDAAIATYGASAKAKLVNPAVRGQHEDQLRTPFNTLLGDMVELLNWRRVDVAAVGESSLVDLKIRPDYAVTFGGALVGHVELKAPGKGADPNKFKDRHDKEQWKRLRSLPNLMYSDGNEFSLWRYGEPDLKLIRLIGDVETSGNKLQAPTTILALFSTFLSWEPIPPRSVPELAKVSARLCRLLRDEVTEQLAAGSPALTRLAVDWRKLLFPEATDATFADGYAQAVTFGLLMARAKNISLSRELDQVAQELGHTSTLIGAALKLLTEQAVNQESLATSLQTLTRVLGVVDWPAISKGDPEAWLYFYEDFLEEYDSKLRRLTGSYYTPPEVVGAMVQLVDEELRSPRFSVHAGLASPTVTLADPAIGTGTFLLDILRKIAETVEADQGAGAVSGAVNDAIKRLIAFEIQLGPFAVAQLRILAEIVELTGGPPATPPRMFLTNTLGDPEDEEGWIPSLLAPIASSRKDANKIKRDEPITVVIGNPPYKEKAMGQGAWVEGQPPDPNREPPLKDWIPPADWGVGAHAKHLRNLYIYFWRWATWKVFDQGPGSKTGIVCFITMAGFLNGPGFQRMRDYMRRTCGRIWVIDCSPEGHQPEVNTRIFQGVQQPVCIVLASRCAQKNSETPAEVRWRALPKGRRENKFKALANVTLAGAGWEECPAGWRDPFLPASSGLWSTFPALEDLFVYNGSGVQTKRTWVIGPDAESLSARWEKLIAAPAEQKEALFHPTLRKGLPADRHIRSVVKEALPGFGANSTRLVDERWPCPSPVRYGFRSFDRQWIIPDGRVITQPNAKLWQSRSEHQVYLTALSRTSPSSGPALTVTGLVPDLDHYKGSFGGRVFPLWSDKEAEYSNFRPKLLEELTNKYGREVDPEELFAYVLAIAGHPAFTSHFADDLSTPGLRIPLTADAGIFREVVDLGRKVVWLHTFGERMADQTHGRPDGPPRLPQERLPRIPAEGAIPLDPESMPDTVDYDPGRQRLLIGKGYVENVSPAVWRYEISGKQVLRQWFSYRKRDRERPIIGDRRPPSPLAFVQPDHWLAEYTTELINVLNVIGSLIDLEPAQAALLGRVLAGPLISDEELRLAGAFESPPPTERKARHQEGPTLFNA